MKRLGKVLSLISILICISFLFVYAQNEEKLSIVTYYPSPYGSYRVLTWGEQPSSGSKLAADGDIELGGDGAGHNTPSIQFGAQKSAVDAKIQLRDANNFDIFAGGGDAGSAGGTVNIYHNLNVGGDSAIDGNLEVKGEVKIGNGHISNGWPDGNYCILKSAKGPCPSGFTQTDIAYDRHAGRNMGGFPVHYEALGTSCADCPEANWRNDLGSWSRFIVCCK